MVTITTRTWSRGRMSPAHQKRERKKTEGGTREPLASCGGTSGQRHHVRRRKILGKKGKKKRKTRLSIPSPPSPSLASGVPGKEKKVRGKRQILPFPFSFKKGEGGEGKKPGLVYCVTEEREERGKERKGEGQRIPADCILLIGADLRLPEKKKTGKKRRAPRKLHSRPIRLSGNLHGGRGISKKGGERERRPSAPSFSCRGWDGRG